METLFGYLEPILATIITAAITWAAAAFTRWSGVQIEQKHRDALHNAIMTGIGYARSRLTGQGAATDNQVVGQAVSFVKQTNPDAVKYFDLDKPGDVKLAELVAATLEKNKAPLPLEKVGV